MRNSIELNLHEVASNAVKRLEEFKGRKLLDVTHKENTYLIELLFEEKAVDSK